MERTSDLSVSHPIDSEGHGHSTTHMLISDFPPLSCQEWLLQSQGRSAQEAARDSVQFYGHRQISEVDPLVIAQKQYDLVAEKLSLDHGVRDVLREANLVS